MRNFFIPAVIAFLSVANFVSPSFAQDSGMSAEKRDVLIAQLENVLQELQSERAAANGTQPSASNVVEGSLSAHDMMTLEERYSSGEVSGGSGTRSAGAESYAGAESSLPDLGQVYDYGSLPVEGYITGEAYLAPLAQAAPVVDQAPLAYAAPVLQTAPIQQAPVVTSVGPLPDITLPPINIIEPAPAPTIIVQQALPVPSFQPVFMNFVAPTPLPAFQPRRHKCCLFGR